MVRLNTVKKTLRHNRYWIQTKSFCIFEKLQLLSGVLLRSIVHRQIPTSPPRCQSWWWMNLQQLNSDQLTRGALDQSIPPFMRRILKCLGQYAYVEMDEWFSSLIVYQFVSPEIHYLTSKCHVWTMGLCELSGPLILSLIGWREE